MYNLKESSLILYLLLIPLLSCTKLTPSPPDSKPTEEALSTLDGLATATMGNYHMFQGASADYEYYIKEVVQIGMHRTDNIAYSGATTDAIYFSYTYNNTKDAGNILDLWRLGYRIIFGTNMVIDKIKEGESPESDQLLGENIFLRALVHFQLINFLGQPYTLGDPSTNLGVPIVTGINIDDKPKRNTVKEVYDFLVADLKKAADLMTIEKPDIYASKEVAWALLSRVYLYMGDNTDAIDYANKVINSGRYHLVDIDTYKKYFTILPENNSETIFAIKGMPADDHGNGAIGSLIYTSPGGAGWGEVYASEQYRNLLDIYPEDARHSFLLLQKDANGNVVKRNGYDKWFILKFSNQNGFATVSSPVILRLAEMYLNRAEAYAKLGGSDNLQKAIADVNLIRERSGLAGDALYTTTDLHGLSSVLAVVLQERRLELAFEGTRSFDLFRNDLPLFRDYPGTHLNPSNPGVDMQDGTQTILPSNPRIIFFVPEQEINLNPNLEQNP